MNVKFGAVTAEALALWRGERELVAAIAGFFFLIPLLGLMLLLAAAGLGQQEQTPEQFIEAFTAFRSDNALTILFATMMLDFGSFALLNLFLQGNGRTLGQVLAITGIRFLPFALIGLIVGAATGLGFSLFVLPALFIFGRTWLAAAAYAAEPELGLLAALREGWRRSGGLVWLQILGAALLAVIPALFVGIFVATLVTAIAVAAGASAVGAVLGNFVFALFGTALLAWLAVLRVAFYRATDDSTGT